jgi:hypothetical protein
MNNLHALGRTNNDGNDSSFADKVGAYYFGDVTHTHTNNRLLTHTLTRHNITRIRYCLYSTP